MGNDVKSMNELFHICPECGWYSDIQSTEKEFWCKNTSCGKFIKIGFGFEAQKNKEVYWPKYWNPSTRLPYVVSC